LEGDAPARAVAEVGTGDVREEMFCVLVEVEFVVNIFMGGHHEFVPSRRVRDSGEGG
jgi:hypothetical protein